MRHMGSFVGQLLIRSFDRAERIYAAMKCRGYPGRTAQTAHISIRAADTVFLLSTTVPFILLRVFDMTALYARLF
jgi:cobalt/nickel transport system permease protein